MAATVDSAAQFGINEYSPRQPFIDFHNRDERWGVLVCHRRAGKTVACVADLVLSALVCKKQDGRYAYVCPQFNQAKDVAWIYIKRLTADIPNIQYNESELRADLPNGARIRLYGADNPDRLRGLYLDGVVLDEFSDMSPIVWGEVVRPMLTDRKGWAVFIGTPKGYNEFYKAYTKAEGDPEWFTMMLKASTSGLIDDKELTDARKGMTDEQYAQEFECSFDAAIRGAYYAKEIQRAQEDGRISRVPYDKALKVHTAWDLGVSDSTAIWYYQQVGREIRVIDYYEASGYGLDHYAGVLDKRGYLYGTHFAPHDIQVRELGTGKSRWDIAKGLGITFKTLPADSVQDGISTARLLISRMDFDEVRCAVGIDALRQYREKRDEKRGINLGPLHDWSSHAADSFRYLAMGFNETQPKPAAVKRTLSWMG